MIEERNEAQESEVSEMCNLSQSVREQGVAQGEKKKSIEMALKMLSKGKFDYEEIAEYTGLSPEKIAELDKKRTA